MPRFNRSKRRTKLQAAADNAADDLAKKLGKMLRDARRRAAKRQREAAAGAGISRGAWGDLERRKDGRSTLAIWCRAAAAVDCDLDAWLKNASAADQPRDAVHLRGQELLIRISSEGGWGALAEGLIDVDARTSRAADVLLHRRRDEDPDEYALHEIFDWFDDVGAALRDWRRKLDAVERFAIARMRDDTLPRVSGCLIVRATQRNRRLVGEHSHFFRSAFPGSGQAWLAALAGRAPMPDTPALLWISVDGQRLFPARFAKTTGASKPDRRK